MDTMGQRLAEAVAGWRWGLPDAHRYLIDTATAALVEGCESEAVAELAGSEDDNPFVVDAAIERAILQLELGSLLEVDLGVLATRRFARDVCNGRLDERELTRWVHTHFHHEADADILNRLAQLDDELDLASSEREIGRIRTRVREAAAEVLRHGMS